MNILVDDSKEDELFDLGIFLSVTVMKGEAEGMCDQRLAKAQEAGQVVRVREGNKWSISTFSSQIRSDRELLGRSGYSGRLGV